MIAGEMKNKLEKLFIHYVSCVSFGVDVCACVNRKVCQWENAIKKSFLQENMGKYIQNYIHRVLVYVVASLFLTKIKKRNIKETM